MLNDVVIDTSLPGALRTYDVIKYPAGELQVRFKKEALESLNSAGRVTVRARIQSAEKLMEIMLLAGAIQGSLPDVYSPEDEIPVNLHIPYLPYSRADRRFTDGDCHGLSTFASLIRRAGFHEIRTLDAHNASAAAMFIPQISNIYPSSLHSFAVMDFKGSDDQITVLFPDEGAAKRYRLDGQQVLNCTKRRNKERGTFDGFTVPAPDNFANRKVLIVDDICDGGGTFLGIVNKLKTDYPVWFKDVEFGLCVTHGIFSKGLDELQRHFVQIYTTNSFLPSVQAVPDAAKLLDVHMLDAFAMLTTDQVVRNSFDSRAV